MEWSCFGLVVNIYVFTSLVRRIHLNSSFHTFCLSKSISNSAVCLIFLIWTVPCSATNSYYLPHFGNVLFGQLAGWGCYIIGPLTQLCMAANRLFVTMFPLRSMSKKKIDPTKGCLAVCWTIGVVFTAIGLPIEGCAYIYDAEIIAWRPENTDCALFLADFILYTVMFIAVLSNSCNFTTFLKIAHEVALGLGANENAIRRKKRLRMFAQSVVQDCVHLIDMLNCSIIYKLNNAAWFQFVCLSLSFLFIHAIDGFIMLLFNYEIQPSWLRKNRDKVVLVNQRSTAISTQ
ncbi:unnamed protein product [Caenorhabditis auriculariae]|uniref:7TM GPCR serpentine receptor class x (Srx) domain-containing protein n=1 Tax=Caenorhabditis auriculariae TaxID=2777116 RepID=A0A8S1HQ74_9PELO|nr:unnamed protein product [Caenorhabditis auriculariae]